MTISDLMIRNYTVKHSNKLKTICEPLQRYFGIKYFWYAKTNARGGHFSIASNPEMHEFYFSCKLYHKNPFFHNPTLITPGLYCYRNIIDPSFQNTVDLFVAKLSVELGGAIVLKKGSDLIRFGYAVDPSQGIDFRTVFFNHIPLLMKFNDYFVQEIQNLLKGAEDVYIDLPSELGSFYNEAPKGLSNVLSKADQCKFLEKLGLINAKDVLKLSPREIECLQHLQQGLTSKESGQRLKLSSRTVETYRESIKNKLNCYSKKELREKADLLQAAKYF